MAPFEFLLQVSAAAAGPITLWMARLVYRWKRETDATIERNAEAIWGTQTPHAGWPGTVELVRSHEQRLRRLEAELGFESAERSPLDLAAADDSVPEADPRDGSGGGRGADDDSRHDDPKRGADDDSRHDAEADRDASDDPKRGANADSSRDAGRETGSRTGPDGE